MPKTPVSPKVKLSALLGAAFTVIEAIASGTVDLKGLGVVLLMAAAAYLKRDPLRG